MAWCSLENKIINRNIKYKIKERNSIYYRKQHVHLDKWKWWIYLSVYNSSNNKYICMQPYLYATTNNWLNNNWRLQYLNANEGFVLPFNRPQLWFFMLLKFVSFFYFYLFVTNKKGLNIHLFMKNWPLKKCFNFKMFYIQ